MVTSSSVPPQLLLTLQEQALSLFCPSKVPSEAPSGQGLLHGAVTLGAGFIPLLIASA